MGPEGIRRFFATHKCNKVCKWLELEPVSDPLKKREEKSKYNIQENSKADGSKKPAKLWSSGASYAGAIMRAIKSAAAPMSPRGRSQSPEARARPGDHSPPGSPLGREVRMHKGEDEAVEEDHSVAAPVKFDRKKSRSAIVGRRPVGASGMLMTHREEDEHNAIHTGSLRSMPATDSRKISDDQGGLRHSADSTEAEAARRQPQKLAAGPGPGQSRHWHVTAAAAKLRVPLSLLGHESPWSRGTLPRPDARFASSSLMIRLRLGLRSPRRHHWRSQRQGRCALYYQLTL
eukprot:750119-Hanusia_phi.AAC.6